MSDFSLESAAENFFDEFDEAFTSFDGAIVAARYIAPYLAVRGNGASEYFATGGDIARYFQKILDDYCRRECRACRHRDLEILALGSAAALATVTWELLRGDGSIVTSWRESYVLVHSGTGLKASASIDHAT